MLKDVATLNYWKISAKNTIIRTDRDIKILGEYKNSFFLLNNLDNWFLIKLAEWLVENSKKPKKRTLGQKNIASEQIKRIRKELCDDYFSVVEIHNVMSDKEKIGKFSRCFVHYLIWNNSVDGRFYLCNYHPKKNGYNYGSAIEKILVKFG